MSEAPVASVLPEMTKSQRREAVAALRDPAAVVEVPASWELCHGDTVHRDHQYYRVRGTIELTGRAYRVHAVRRAPELPVNVFAPGDGGVLKYPMAYSGDVDPARKVVRGTVEFDLRAYNCSRVILALVLVPLVAILAMLDERPLPVAVLVGPTVAAVVLRLTWFTRRRRARTILPDLQRIAALAADVEVKVRYPAEPRRPREL